MWLATYGADIKEYDWHTGAPQESKKLNLFQPFDNDAERSPELELSKHLTS